MHQPEPRAATVSGFGRPPDVQGPIAQSPLPHLLVHILARKATGTLVLRPPAGSEHLIYFVRGAPAALKTSLTVAPLGEMLIKLGILEQEAVDRAKARASASYTRLGRQLVLDGTLQRPMIVAALRSQIVARLSVLVRTVQEGTYELYDRANLIEGPTGDEPTPCDPLATLLVLVRHWPDHARMNADLARLGYRRIVIHDVAALERFAMSEDEATVIERVGGAPLSYPGLLQSRVADPSVVRSLIYTLAITRHIDVGRPGTRPLGISGQAIEPLLRGAPFPLAELDLAPRTEQATDAEAAIASFAAVGVSRDTTSAEIDAAYMEATRAMAPSVSGLEAAPPSSQPPSVPFGLPEPQSEQMLEGRRDAEIAARREHILEKEGSISEQDYFAALGVSRDAKTAEIEAAYLAAAQLLNPNTIPAELADLRERAAKILFRLAEARQTLVDPDRRARYVVSLQEGGPRSDDAGTMARMFEAWTNFQRAEAMLKKGDLAAAERYASLAVQYDPGQSDYVVMLGWLRGMQSESEFPAALKLLDEAIAKYAPTDSPVLRYARIVNERVNRPLDEWAVAATLEAEGLRDADARQHFDFPNLFAFAREVFHSAERMDPVPPKPPPREETASPARRAIQHLIEGSAFAWPMIGQSLCVLVTGYSLNASLDFTELQATVVGLGTVMSFVTTGGVVMAIGRQGSMYHGAKFFTLMRDGTAQLLRIGMLVGAVTVLGGFAVQLLSPIADPFAWLVAVAYFMALSAFWLSLAVLYVLKLHHWTFALTVLGATAVAAAVRGLGVHVYVAQLGGIVLTSLAALYVARRAMAKLVPSEPKHHADIKPHPPDVLAGILLPFAAYGLGYFTLLFMDRLMVWTAPSRPLPQPVWFHTQYELGMEWALVSLLAPVSYLEHVLHEFNLRMKDEQAVLPFTELPLHRQRVAAFARQSFLSLVSICAVSLVGTYAFGRLLQRLQTVPKIREFFSSPVTEYVFWPAAIGYQLLSLGLMAGLVFFTLGRGMVVIRAMWNALVAATIIAFIASRVIGAEWAISGFLAGSALFAAEMLRAGYALSRRIDFYYYSAY